MYELLSHPVIATVIFLGILVFVHEAGHFLVGKFFGIAVEIFSIGFGPRVFSFRRGETNYCLSMIPLGGFVKFFGAVPSEPVPSHIKGREFHRASIFARLCTVAAGPIANFILAIVVYSVMGLHGIEYPPPIVGELLPGSPAERAGLQFQDKVIRIGEEPISTWRDLQRQVSENPGKNLLFTVVRKGTQLRIKIKPDIVEDSQQVTPRGRIGVSPGMVPSIVTVVSPDVKAKGLRTGDRIISIAVPGSEPVAIRYWKELESFVEANHVAGGRFDLIVESEASIQKLQKESQNERQISLELKPGLSGLMDSQLTIGDFTKSDFSGLEKGDRLLEWDGLALTSSFQLSDLISKNYSTDVVLTVLRDFVKTQVKVKLSPIDVQRAEGKVTLYTLPVLFLGALESPDTVTERYSNPLEALKYGALETYRTTSMILGAIIGLFTGEMPLKALGGPLAIAKVASDSVKLGIIPFLNLLAMISINLGLLNLIPIPVLDGGQMLLIGAEGVNGRPLPEQAVEGYQKVGFVMVLALIAMATYNDLGRFWASMVKGASTLF